MLFASKAMLGINVTGNIADGWVQFFLDFIHKHLYEKRWRLHKPLAGYRRIRN